jgi:hypothetical protein
MTIARWLIGFVGVMGVGGFLADFVIPPTARQHMRNPAWPPHAKFHNAQTILLGIGLGVLTIVLVTISTADPKFNVVFAACTASLYWLSMLIAPAFGGTAWVDPEFRDDTARPLGMHPQHILAIVAVLIVVVALGLNMF